MSIRFTVSYSLSEYRSFVRDYAPSVLDKELAAKGKAPRARGRSVVLWFVVHCSSLFFFYKRHRMPVCEFVIDEEKITRTTALGALVVPWSDVASVHRLSQGYLVVKESGGAMPLPYRCVAGDDAACLAALIESKHL